MSQGKRYTDAEKEEIMAFRESHTYQETTAKYDVSQMSLARWSRTYKKKPSTGDAFKGDPAYKIPLQVLKYIEGVKAVALYTDMTEGSALAAITGPAIGEDALFLAMITLLATADESAKNFELGTPHMILTQHQNGIFFLKGITAHILLVMVIGSDRDVPALVAQDYRLIERVCADLAKIAQPPATP